MPIVHPKIHSSERGAESDRWRDFGTVARQIAAVREVVKHDRRPSFLVEYQPAGQGHKLSPGVFMEGEGDRLRAKLEAGLGPLVQWEVRRFTPGTDVLRNQLHQDLTRPVRSTSPEETEAAPVWQAEAAATEAEPVHGPPDG
jgi:hypothetical protein